MSRNERPIHDPNVIAAIHQVGQRWHAVVARREAPAADGGPPTSASGTAAGPNASLRILDSEEFPADSVALRLPAWLQRHQCGRLIGVLPATVAICRTSQLPNGPTERLLPALRLQAEGHLLGDLPAHRIGMGILAAADGETSRTGVIVAWPTGAALGDSALALDRSIEVDHSWIPETAALATLVDRSRPAEPVVWCDRDSGGVSIFLRHPGGVLLRATREENGTPEDWVGGVGRVIADSALSVGRTPDEVKSAVAAVQTAVAASPDGSLLALPPELERLLPGSVAGASTSPAWWQRHGLAVGALIAATGPAAPLASLRREPAIERPSPIVMVAERLSRPRVATTLAIAALALIVVWPVAAAGLRLAILRTKVPELRTAQHEVAELERTLAMYRALGDQTSPMHKILADLANATPDGIEIDTLTVNRGDPNISLRGQATPREGRSGVEQVFLMSTRMSESRIFDRTSPSADLPNAAGVTNFRLTARVPRPYLTVDYPEEWDFGALTLAERRYGRRDAGTPPRGDTAPPDRGAATETAVDRHQAADPADRTDAAVEVVVGDSPRVPSPRPTGGGRTVARPSDPAGDGIDPDAAPDDAVAAGDDAADDRPAIPGDTRRVGHRGTGEATGAATRGGRLGGRVEEVPEPLSREQIRAMSRAEAQSALAAVSRARMRGDLDEETATRLREEFDLLLQQTKDAG